MIYKLKFHVFSVVVVLLLLSSVSFVAAQYATSQTTDITIGSDGKFTAVLDNGVKYEIQGRAGATGSVTTAVYNGNPQPTASFPHGITLSRFIVITFDMDSNDFVGAKITFSYTANDVKNLALPYSIYKYLPGSNSYVELPSTVDTATKTISITLDSVDDPLFGIGGVAVEKKDVVSTTSWIMVAIGVIAVVLLVFYLFNRLHLKA